MSESPIYYRPKGYRRPWNVHPTGSDCWYCVDKYNIIRFRFRDLSLSEEDAEGHLTPWRISHEYADPEALRVLQIVAAVGDTCDADLMMDVGL